MGSLRLTFCTGILACTALAPAAHAAPAADAGSVSVTPAFPAPGSDVSLQVRGCSGQQGTATSAAFVSDARLTGGQGTLSGETRVRSSLEPGLYDVRITCADSVITRKITVGGKGAGQSQEPGRRPGADATPVAPVHAGGGGTAHFATVATSESGPDTGQEVTGLALAGIAAVAVGLGARRSRRDR
ncbi:hypothetical protein GCM10010260_01560 [Streptomyces filipinensis]|uniref:Secreted protein n=1 Tax=Streptomyces filipinensis TaxID=66887 RepID=A0A918I4E0_9ACTN|nr:hypothetical protein [Streptomyces filipinensis]GGU73501.1 hypothetical protein GCM10010260_01560 [Streptomyces filipinensis]